MKKIKTRSSMVARAIVWLVEHERLVTAGVVLFAALALVGAVEQGQP